MPSFSIKHATVEDIPTIIAIQEITWEATYSDILTKDQIDFMFEKIYAPESLLRQFNVDHHHFLILLNNDKPEGFVSVSEEDPEKFKLHKIYVLPSTQGTGAGKYLLAETENYVKSAGGKKLGLNVHRQNKAKGFYEKMGFVVTGEEDIPFGPYTLTDYKLVKELT